MAEGTLDTREKKLPEIHTSDAIVNDVLGRCYSDSLDASEALSRETSFSRAVYRGMSLCSAGTASWRLFFNLPYQPEIAEHTLKLLARHQGKKLDAWRDEEPGAILHELRRGEYANLKSIPQTPYYGSVDATPLFLLLLARHAEWTGSSALFEELRTAVDEALNWMSQYGDLLGNGYLSYQCKSKDGLQNQGWEDSGDGIMNEDGSLAEPPIAMVEVQGYVYAAKCGIAKLFELAQMPSRAEILRQEAGAIRERFNRDFWLEDKGCYALALQKGGHPASVISSNPGHALWCEIVDLGQGPKGGPAADAKRTCSRDGASERFRPRRNSTIRWGTIWEVSGLMITRLWQPDSGATGWTPKPIGSSNVS